MPYGHLQVFIKDHVTTMSSKSEKESLLDSFLVQETLLPAIQIWWL